MQSLCLKVIFYLIVNGLQKYCPFLKQDSYWVSYVSTKWVNRRPLFCFPTDAAFVGDPIEFGDHVYYFFRETATEYINAGKIVYSRVGRVCKVMYTKVNHFDYHPLFQVQRTRFIDLYIFVHICDLLWRNREQVGATSFS